MVVALELSGDRPAFLDCDISKHIGYWMMKPPRITYPSCLLILLFISIGAHELDALHMQCVWREVSLLGLSSSGSIPGTAIGIRIKHAKLGGTQILEAHLSSKPISGISLLWGDLIPLSYVATAS